MAETRGGMGRGGDAVDFRAVVAAAMERGYVTQARLSAETGITQSRISDYLRGKRDMNGRSLGRIFAALGVVCTGGTPVPPGREAEKLTGGTPVPPAPVTRSPGSTSGRGRR